MSKVSEWVAQAIFFHTPQDIPEHESAVTRIQTFKQMHTSGLGQIPHPSLTKAHPFSKNLPSFPLTI